jgi:hypothetical protein
VEGFCEHVNKLSGSMKCWEVLEQLLRRAQLREYTHLREQYSSFPF